MLEEQFHPIVLPSFLDISGSLHDLYHILLTDCKIQESSSHKNQSGQHGKKTKFWEKSCRHDQENAKSDLYSIVYFQSSIYVNQSWKFITQFSLHYHWIWHFKSHSWRTFRNLFKQVICAWHFSYFCLKIGSLEFFQTGERSWKFQSEFEITSVPSQNDGFIAEFSGKNICQKAVRRRRSPQIRFQKWNMVLTIDFAQLLFATYSYEICRIWVDFV